jgi:hypothetical protein
VCLRIVLARGLHSNSAVEPLCDGLCHFRLQRNHIVGVAIVAIRPKMGVAVRLDQLDLYAHFAIAGLDPAFEDAVDAEFMSDIAQGAVPNSKMVTATGDGASCERVSEYAKSLVHLRR